MSDIDFIRAEIERYRAQVGRQRKEIMQLQERGYRQPRPKHSSNGC
jgi:hypothetical protein